MGGFIAVLTGELFLVPKTIDVKLPTFHHCIMYSDSECCRTLYSSTVISFNPPLNVSWVGSLHSPKLGPFGRMLSWFIWCVKCLNTTLACDPLAETEMLKRISFFSVVDLPLQTGKFLFFSQWLFDLYLLHYKNDMCHMVTYFPWHLKSSTSLVGERGTLADHVLMVTKSSAGHFKASSHTSWPFWN